MPPPGPKAEPMPPKLRFLERHYTSRMVRRAADWDVTLPPPMRWPVNWEWTYTFTQAWAGLKRSLRWKLAHLCLGLLKRLGGQVTVGEPLFVDETVYQPVLIEDLATAIFAKLNEVERDRLYHPERGHGLILVGPDALPQLLRELEPRPFYIEREYAYAPRGYGRYSDPVAVVSRGTVQIPVLYLPDFVGIAVIPDLAGAGRFIKEQQEAWYGAHRPIGITPDRPGRLGALRR